MILIKTYRDAFHGLNRETWLLSLVIFINRCGTFYIDRHILSKSPIDPVSPIDPAHPAH